jgi:hypothetical protein
MRFWVKNRHNGKRYPAEGQHWPQHGWSIKIYDFGEGVWGEEPRPGDVGPVIARGWADDLAQSWEMPAISGESPSKVFHGTLASPQSRLKEPENVRDKEMQRLAQSLSKGFKKESVHEAAQALAKAVLEAEWDIDEPNQRRMAVAWLSNFLNRINDGGTWAVPRSGTVYNVSHKHKTLTRAAGPGDPPTEAIAREAGWKVYGVESN